MDNLTDRSIAHVRSIISQLYADLDTISDNTDSSLIFHVLPPANSLTR